MRTVRFALWSLSAALAFGIDAITKAAPHPMVVYHYSHTPAVILVLLGIFLCVLGTMRSRLIAIGSGLMFGGLLGNGGQVVLFGYASDWLPVGGWLTNAADISGAVGLLCCFADYVRTGTRSLRSQDATQPSSTPPPQVGADSVQ